MSTVVLERDAEEAMALSRAIWAYRPHKWKNPQYAPGSGCSTFLGEEAPQHEYAVRPSMVPLVSTLTDRPGVSFLANEFCRAYDAAAWKAPVVKRFRKRLKTLGVPVDV